jgi:hypothetical protein
MLMVSNKKLLLPILGLLLLFGAATIVYSATARPRADIAETRHDFGTVSEDQRLSHTFVIRNRGRKPLEITKVKADCACTATDYDRIIRPSAEGTMTLAIKPFSLLGNFAKKTTVSLNDPNQPKVVFTLQGVSRPLIDIQPSHIIRFRGKPGEEISQQVRLTSNLPEPWEMKEWKTTIPQFIDVQLRVEEPGKSYVVEVRQTRRQPGKYYGRIELLTTAIKRPRLMLRVFGEVLPPEVATPSPPSHPNPLPLYRPERDR